MFKLAIVGLGPAGIFTLASLPESILSEVLLIEKGCICGDLATQYGSVIANISKSEIISTFTSIPRWSLATFPELDKYQNTESPPLSVVCEILRKLSRPDIEKAHLHTCVCKGLEHAPQGGWMLQTSAGTFMAKKVILCLGGTPKTLDLPVPSIPLSVAIGSQLTNFISPADTIVVFGTSHSGTLILKNLKMLGCTSVYAVHKGPPKFKDGLKQEAANIVVEIQAGAWGPYTPTFIEYSDFAALYRIVKKAHAVIYAIGFEPRTIPGPLWGPTGSTGPTLYRFGADMPAAGFTKFIQEITAALPSLLE